MSKPRRQKKPNTQQAALSKLPPRPASESQKTPWSRIVELLGGIAAVIAIIGVVYDVFRQPEIRANPGRIENPFALRFALRNPSWLFSMYDLGFVCRPAKVVWEGDNTASSVEIHQSNVLHELGPGKVAEFSCPLTTTFSFLGRPIVFAQVEITVDFKTLIFSRTADSEEFTWTRVAPYWIEGKIIN